MNDMADLKKSNVTCEKKGIPKPGIQDGPVSSLFTSEIRMKHEKWNIPHWRDVESP